MDAAWIQFGMAANPKIQTRITPLMFAYLEDLIKTKLYGKDEAAVVRNLIETGVRNAIAANHIKIRDAAEFGGED